MKITKKEFDSLYSDNITKKEFDRIISKIDNRFSEIVLTLKPSLRTKGWFDYENCNYDSEESGGYFDLDWCKEVIEVGGEYSELPEPFSCGFPTRWLWEDFEVEFAKEVAGHKKALELSKTKKKQTAEKLKIKKAKLRKSIERKLTKEELKVIKFK
jgi:hypothetical protein